MISYTLDRTKSFYSYISTIITDADGSHLSNIEKEFKYIGIPRFNRRKDIF